MNQDLPTLADIILDWGSERPPYDILLRTAEWHERRTAIVDRDQKKCQSCGKSETFWWSPDLYVSIQDWKEAGFVEQGSIAQDMGGYFFQHESDHRYMHVHHKYYVLGKLPWEYEDDALVTLCNWCHWDLHQNETVPVYEVGPEGRTRRNLTACSRCFGAGVFPQYKHVQNDVCFRCNGARYEELIGRGM